MAGAIAGAFYGIDDIPRSWMAACEGVSDAQSYADQLHNFASERPQRLNSSGQHYPYGSGLHLGGRTEESHKHTAVGVRPNDQHQTAACSYQEAPHEDGRHLTGSGGNMDHPKSQYK